MAQQLTALVTGASSGIGRATAVELAKRGHTVFAAARRASELEALARSNERIEVVQIDVTDSASVSAAVSLVASAFPPEPWRTWHPAQFSLFIASCARVSALEPDGVEGSPAMNARSDCRCSAVSAKRGAFSLRGTSERQPSSGRSRPAGVA